MTGKCYSVTEYEMNIDEYSKNVLSTYFVCKIS